MLRASIVILIYKSSSLCGLCREMSYTWKGYTIEMGSGSYICLNNIREEDLLSYSICAVEYTRAYIRMGGRVRSVVVRRQLCVCVCVCVCS